VSGDDLHAALEATITWVNGRLMMHGGGVEVVAVEPSDEGAVVEVRFTGMCTACAWKTLTWFGTVKDAIEAVPGIARVEAAGTRVSEQAASRVRALASGRSSGVTSGV
jgi:Fe-S cluster biogenesis protein NfuA